MHKNASRHHILLIFSFFHLQNSFGVSSMLKSNDNSIRIHNTKFWCFLGPNKWVFYHKQ